MPEGRIGRAWRVFIVALFALSAAIWLTVTGLSLDSAFFVFCLFMLAAPVTFLLLCTSVRGVLFYSYAVLMVMVNATAAFPLVELVTVEGYVLGVFGLFVTWFVLVVETGHSRWVEERSKIPVAFADLPDEPYKDQDK